MSDMTRDQMRAEFEAWILDQPGGTPSAFRRIDFAGAARLGQYVLSNVELAWRAWQAACAQAAPAVEPKWLPIESAPMDGTVLVYLAPIDAIDLAHKRKDTQKWMSGGGTIWPNGTCTHWMPLPPSPNERSGE